MILVTGATGHIGNVLVRELVAKGEWVRALVLEDEDRTALEGLAVEQVEGNVLDLESLRRACEAVDMVYHLAGVISIMPGKNDWVRRVNVEGTQNVIQVAREKGVRRLVYTSSIHALRRVPHGVIIDETIPFDPDHAISAYDQSKAQASLEVLCAVQQGLDAVIICPTGVIGPYDYRVSEMGRIILDAIEEKPLFYLDGMYDFVDVRDVALGMILAGEKGRTGESYILSGQQLRVIELIDIIQQETGKQLKPWYVPLVLAQFFSLFTPLYYRLTRQKPRLTSYSLKTLQSNSKISHAKAKRELGYAPRALKQSVVDSIHWFLTMRKRINLSPSGI